MTNIHDFSQQIIILLGPPGAGKGSQAILLKEQMHLAHVSTGDLLRENIKRNFPLGIQAKTYMDKGQFVPDSLIFDMLFERIVQKDCEKGYILDGFPRTIAQAETLQKKVATKSKILAINLSLPDSIIVQRLTKRMLCTECQAPYHLLFSPPKLEGKCDHCKGKLIQRSDDSLEVVQNRLSIYHQQTAPLISFYENQGLLHEVNAQLSKEAILLNILQQTKTPAIC